MIIVALTVMFFADDYDYDDDGSCQQGEWRCLRPNNLKDPNMWRW